MSNTKSRNTSTAERTKLTVKPEDVTMETWQEEVVFECDAVSDVSTSIRIIWKHDDVQIAPDEQPE